jgi:hypothetical protein
MSNAGLCVNFGGVFLCLLYTLKIKIWHHRTCTFVRNLAVCVSKLKLLVDTHATSMKIYVFQENSQIHLYRRASAMRE